MKLKLKRLELRNFKGGTQDIEYSDCTDIFGDNAVGKTRTFDALLWLLFGKDSEGKTDFEIKPLDSKNQVKHKIDIEVTGHFDHNGRNAELMKVYKEKWTKKRGESQSTLTGHTTDYYIDKMNVQKKEYETFIYSIIETEKFKMLTNPVYFESLKWEEKRRVLFSLVDSISDKDIAGSNEKFTKLLEELNGKDMQAYKKNIASQRRMLNDELKHIPSRIDEVERSKPIPVDFLLLKKQLDKHRATLLEINKVKKNEELAMSVVLEKRKSTYDEIQKLENLKIDLKSIIQIEMSSQRHEISSFLNKLNLELKTLETEINNKSSLISELNSNIETKEVELIELRNNYHAENDKVFNSNEITRTCPVCKQHLPEENINRQMQEMQNNFNTEKQNILSEINKRGQNITKAIENEKLRVKLHEDAIKDSKLKVKDLAPKIEAFELKLKEPAKNIDDVINSNKKYISLNSKIEELKSTLPATPETSEENNIIETELNDKIKAVENKLLKEVEIKKADARIKELEEKTRTLSQQIADLEQKEYTIEQFNKMKVELIESTINAKFKYVQFKLYQQQINEGEKETCITLIDGVPYNSANYAARINAGLDIINVLSEHYDIYVPIVIDNRESISEILVMNTQVINLIKSKGETSLRIENN